MSVPGIAPEYAQALANDPQNAAAVLSNGLGAAAPGMGQAAAAGALAGVGLLPPAPMAPPPMLPPPPPAAAPVPAARPAGGGGVARVPGVASLEGEITKAGEQGLQGIQKVQQAKQEGADSLANAYGDLSVEQRAHAAELAETQKSVRVRQAALEQDDQANLQRAREYTIPDFWKGAEGAKVGSILSIAMGGIASGILGGPNGALQIVNKNVDDYFHRQKEKVDNLYRYAEMKGRVNAQTSLRYAQELTDLQAQHLAVQQSILSRIEVVKAKNQGNVDAASTDSLEANLRQQIIDGKERERANRSQILLATQGQAETARHNRATEGIAREAAGAKQGASEDKTAVFDEKGALIGHVTGGRGGAQAFSTRDADFTRAEHSLAALAEDIAKNGERVFTPDAVKRRNSLHKAAVGGVATVSPLGKTIEALHNEEEQIGKSGAYTAFGANPEALTRKIQEIRDQRERYRAQTLVGYGPSRAEGAPQAQQQQQQIPIGARATSGGKPIVMTANGWQFAQ